MFDKCLAFCQPIAQDKGLFCFQCFEQMVHMELRLQTLEIALDEVKWHEEDIVEKKQMVSKHLDDVKAHCQDIRCSLPCLLDTGPIKFSSGVFLWLNSNLF